MGQQADAKAEVLAGLVERVTFHNPENGLCVLRLKARGIAIWSQQWAIRR